MAIAESGYTGGKMERDLYNATSERLWEKIEFHRDKFNPKSVNWKKPFPADQLKPNKFLMKLVAERT